MGANGAALVRRSPQCADWRESNTDDSPAAAYRANSQRQGTAAELAPT